MFIKDGVLLAGLDIRMRPVLIASEKLWIKYGQDGVTVTSAVDGVHSAGSLHYYGLALDLRTRYFTPEEASSIGAELAVELGEDYDVVVHKTHIHVEYDPIWRD